MGWINTYRPSAAPATGFRHADMSAVWIRSIAQYAAFLLTGVLIGWWYDSALWGLLIAISVLLVWHVYHLYLLEHWLTTGEHGPLPDGSGPWSLVLARIHAINDSARASRQAWRGLVKEVRASTKAFPDGGVILNEHNEITRANKAARQLLGLKKKRDRGARIDNLLRHPDFVGYLEHGSKKESVEIPGPLGGDQWLSCRVIPFGLDQRLLLVRDVTQNVRNARMRRDFAANASHELRTPLTVIAGYLDVMAEDEQLAETWRRPVADMREQAERMSRLVHDLLQLAKLESAMTCSRETAVDLGKMIESARRDALAVADRPQVIDVSLESKRGILGEEIELQSVVSNLVSNAIRYTPGNGAVTIEWSVDEDGGHLSVSDTGIGIAADDIARVTERFYRTDAGRARQKGGTGLGLAIVKHALKRHDARLEIKSQLGKGTRVTCHFPLDRLTAA